MCVPTINPSLFDDTITVQSIIKYCYSALSPWLSPRNSIKAGMQTPSSATNVKGISQYFLQYSLKINSPISSPKLSIFIVLSDRNFSNETYTSFFSSSDHIPI